MVVVRVEIVVAEEEVREREGPGIEEEKDTVRGEMKKYGKG